MAIRILNNQYKQKKLNPEIVFNIINKNIDEKNTIYNAFISRAGVNSETACRDSRKRYDQNVPLGVLDGIPIVVKDNFCVENELTTCGSKMLENFRPNYTATSVSKLVKAGAIIIGKTNMDEFAMGSGSVNSQFGGIVNPWQDYNNEICVTGGSSGGTAVAIAAGWALGGLGSDTGGSIRLPAALTGLVGLKPTYGAVSRHGVVALMNSLDTPSIMTRLIDDAEIIFNAVKGRDFRDPTSIEYPDQTDDVRTVDKDITKLTIGIPQEFYPEGLIDDIAELWEETAEYFSKLGCNVVRVNLPHTPLAGKCYSILCCAEVASNMARYSGIHYGYRDENFSKNQTDEFFDNLLSKSRSAGLGAAVRERILMGNFFLLKSNRKEYFDQARKIWQLIYDDFQSVFKQVDVLLTPSALEDAPAVKSFTVMDNRIAMIKGDICTQPASLAGVPAVTLPVKLSSRGLPIGIQLITNKFEEKLLFAVGRVIEKWAQFEHRFRFVHESTVESLNKPIS